MIEIKSKLARLGTIVTFVSVIACESAEERSAARVTDLRAEAQGEQAGARRCGDFLSEEEAKQLGVEEYRAGKGDKNPLRGVVCTTHPVVLTIFMAAQYRTMLAGAKALKGMKQTEGPALGKETFWFEALDAHQVMFVSKSGNYAFGVSGEDKALVEKAAKMAADGR
jgi:hypothetical protein